ncbi:unnamed protein product [Polarella glacialis]|uniref:Uncharacterized protein n=1 Tax=Polarella glacialis TaxID=89957 RepID=A0A813IAR6_POLGL|nr:unnamed protein product [Polarella glacialis]
MDRGTWQVEACFGYQSRAFHAPCIMCAAYCRLATGVMAASPISGVRNSYLPLPMATRHQSPHSPVLQQPRCEINSRRYLRASGCDFRSSSCSCQRRRPASPAPCRPVLPSACNSGVTCIPPALDLAAKMQCRSSRGNADTLAFGCPCFHHLEILPQWGGAKLLGVRNFESELSSLATSLLTSFDLATSSRMVLPRSQGVHASMLLVHSCALPGEQSNLPCKSMCGTWSLPAPPLIERTFCAFQVPHPSLNCVARCLELPREPRRQARASLVARGPSKALPCLAVSSRGSSCPSLHASRRVCACLQHQMMKQWRTSQSGQATTPPCWSAGLQTLATENRYRKRRGNLSAAAAYIACVYEKQPQGAARHAGYNGPEDRCGDRLPAVLHQTKDMRHRPFSGQLLASVRSRWSDILLLGAQLNVLCDLALADARSQKSTWIVALVKLRLVFGIRVGPSMRPASCVQPTVGWQHISSHRLTICP